jgi:hypothetical protein
VNAREFARVLRAAAEECDAIASEASAVRADWIDQRASALGPRRHCRAVQRRIAEGTDDAAVIGRNHLLSAAAHTEELRRGATRSKSTAMGHSVADELRAELRLLGGRR